MAKVGFFFYTGDWIKDTRVLSVAERGAWIDILCLMNENGGVVGPWTLAQYDQFWGTHYENTGDPCAEYIIEQFERLKICDALRNSDGSVTLRSRRMSRESHAMSHADRQRNYRERQKKKRRQKKSVTANVTKSHALPSPSLYISYSDDSSSRTQKSQDPASPEPSADALISKNGKKKMASQNLSVVLKKETDRLYESDPVKYADLIKWVKQGQKYKYSDREMAEALSRFWEYRYVIEDWYPYLDQILDEVIRDRNESEFETEHDELKSEEADFAKRLK